MKLGVEVYVNLSQLSEELKRLGRSGLDTTKNGDKCISVTTFINPNKLNKADKHGVCTPSLTREEKGASQEGKIVGNAYVFWSEDGSHAKKQAGTQGQSFEKQPEPAGDVFSDDIPFDRLRHEYLR